MLSRAVLLGCLVALALPVWASAAGGRYTIVGGTRPERQAVVSALEASSFDWSLVRTEITIRIVRGLDSQAVPGTIWLDANLLDAGTFSWGVVQHEYAHQVDYALFDDAIRVHLLAVAGWRRVMLRHRTVESRRLRLRAVCVDAGLVLLAVAQQLPRAGAAR